MVGAAAAEKLLVMYAYRNIVQDGGLMSYGPNHCCTARHVGEILNRGNIADLPTRFDLVTDLPRVLWELRSHQAPSSPALMR